MTPKEKQLVEIIGQVRLCFNQLKTLAEQLHHDLGVNPSMRAVMEALALHGPQTVPAIANARSVSRQHIQLIMNALQEGGFVTSSENPAHRRSPLFELSPKGQSTFKTAQAREVEPVMQIAKSLSAGELRTGQDFLTKLNLELRNRIKEGEDNE